MNDSRSVTPPLSWRAAALLIVGAAACFHLAYSPESFGPLRLLIVGYVICLAQLSRLKTTRLSFYAGLAAGFICVAPQLTCFWQIFGPAAIVLWIILAFWIAVFTGTAHAALARFGPIWTVLLIPFLWTGLEYFRSELYYLKFSWLNVGYAFSGWDVVPFHILGMYGTGFIAAICASLFLGFRLFYATPATIALIWATSFLSSGQINTMHWHDINVAGVQMEFPIQRDIPAALDSLLAQHTNADLLVLSEYTLEGPVPDSLKDWCRRNHRYLVVGGKDPAPNNNYYDTAFVVGPNGDIVFRQGKSVPIQLFKDGLPAPKQELWNSPWGKIGICICYDLSYTRVVDRLVKMGAQMIIVPTMDVVDWGKRQHQLHALVAPVRAAEYGLPIFRVASSGISQSVDSHGVTVATAPFAGEGQTLFATFDLPAQGSIPADRFLAPIAAGITGVVLLVLRGWKKGKRRDDSAETGKGQHSAEPLTAAPVYAQEENSQGQPTRCAPEPERGHSCPQQGERSGGSISFQLWSSFSLSHPMGEGQGEGWVHGKPPRFKIAHRNYEPPKRGIESEVANQPKTAKEFLPLPKGEGRGEGEEPDHPSADFQSLVSTVHGKGALRVLGENSFRFCPLKNFRTGAY